MRERKRGAREKAYRDEKFPSREKEEKQGKKERENRERKI